MRKLVVLTSIVIHSLIGYSQNKLFTMEEVVIKSRTTLAPENVKQFHWINGSSIYSYIVTKDDMEVLSRSNPASKEITSLVSLKELNQQIRLINEDTFKHFPQISWENDFQFIIEKGKSEILFDVKEKKSIKRSTVEFPNNAKNRDKHSKKNNLAYTIDNNLYLYENEQKVHTPITFDKDINIVNGQVVHREEFGIHKGTFWSPDGNFLAFYRMDQTMVKDYPIVNYAEKPAKSDLIKYPMAGDKSHHVKLGVYDVKTKKTIFLKTGQPDDQYLTNIAWSPDEQYIYIAILNRDQNFLLLNQYKSSTGEFVKTLFEEKEEKYIQPLNPIMFLNNKSGEFVWQSRRDGYNHLYLYNKEGKLLKQVTKGKWEVITLFGFDQKGEKAYYLSTQEGPVNRDAYSIELNSGKTRKITSGKGVHHVAFSEDKSFCLDNYSSLETPREVRVLSEQGKEVQELVKAENPIKDYKLGEVKLFSLLGESGESLYCRMVKPIDFDSTKKYPVIVYVYGGPNVQLINNSWISGNDFWFQYLAQKGFVVFTLDNRGSANRGKGFEQATFKNLGTEEMKDQLKGVEFLKSLSFVDNNRIGIYGWSYGGFMSISMMTRNPEVFKVGVAGGPVIDWSYYEVMYTERYMDTPEDNMEGYDKSNLLNYVENLKGKLMLIHGSSDDVVLWQHSLMYLKNAIDKGVSIDYFVYPGHFHNVRGKDRVHLMNRISNYFLDNL